MMYGHWYGQSFGLGPVAIVSLGLIAALVAIVIIVLKGYSLWCAAKRDEKWWFIILLVVNTVGILELVYLIFVVKKWPKIFSGKASSGTSAPSTPSPSK